MVGIGPALLGGGHQLFEVGGHVTALQAIGAAGAATAAFADTRTTSHTAHPRTRAW